MKTISFFILTCIVLIACKKLKTEPKCIISSTEESIEYCGVINPAENLVWLRDTIKYRDSMDFNVLVTGIFIPSSNENGFSLQYELSSEPNPITEIYFYRCDGTYICSYSSGFGGSNCGSIFSEIVYKDVVFKNY